MNIPASFIIQKMEAELAQLKASVNNPQQASEYREHAQAIKTYAELLLDSGSKPSYASSQPVQHAQVADVKPSAPMQQPQAQPTKQASKDIYDNGNEPESDSLFDF
ncbi:YwdI family protein [Paenalkalicoccus suaedae]|uniref:YwdI family protein n=1 Tax=Paenalkalicoccus suaedae TaxID=2592382 RepID=A0A859FIC2_9BACI|nr:YwdI family protein [Paenalkalicoccus suaedae]QKS72861.1 YwdI family protein [Paenalkalicoccus suaedae]